MAEAKAKASAAIAAAAEVKTIFVYPIKSCQGISLPQATLTPHGLRWDRLWMIVNSKGRMYTQRVEPKLALIQVELPPEAALSPPGWSPDHTSFMVVRSPTMNTSLKIPMVQPQPRAVPKPNGIGVSVWEWSGSAFDEGDEAANWFSLFLGKSSRLVRFDEATQCRRVNSESDYAKNHTIKFNDWYPFQIISQGSLNALNARLSEPVLINRFRPNFVVDGCEPFAEDLWNEIKISDFVFVGGELCYRCKVPTINQETAELGSEPTETLMKFRSDKILRPDKDKHQGRVYMGQMLVCKNYTPETGKNKNIRVGDPVHVLKMASSYEECVI